MPRCVVSFVDSDGIRHAVEVEAESLFEAAALAISAFRRHECEPAPVSKLDIEITSTVKTHRHAAAHQRLDQQRRQEPEGSGAEGTAEEAGLGNALRSQGDQIGTVERGFE
jgi:hypothetical protein